MICTLLHSSFIIISNDRYNRSSRGVAHRSEGLCVWWNWRDDKESYGVGEKMMLLKSSFLSSLSWKHNDRAKQTFDCRYKKEYKCVCWLIIIVGPYDGMEIVGSVVIQHNHDKHSFLNQPKTKVKQPVSLEKSMNWQITTSKIKKCKEWGRKNKRRSVAIQNQRRNSNEQKVWRSQRTTSFVHSRGRIQAG